MELSKPMKQDLTQRDSFTIYMCVGGEATIKNNQGSTSIKRGETVLLAAASRHVEIDTQHAKLLEVTI
jgi:mannose-6-phosphate isomerase